MFGLEKGAVMSARITARAHGCWTERYTLRHCEGYRVVGPDGPAGYVDEIWTFEDGDVSALIVEAPTQRLLVATEDIGTIDEAAELVMVRRLRRPGLDPDLEAVR
jgi:hypothetical protein